MRARLLIAASGLGGKKQKPPIKGIFGRADRLNEPETSLRRLGLWTMPIPGNLLATAMAVMPHKDVDRALEVVLSLDIPFWPQLPRVSFFEDMYFQASEHFLGIVLDMENHALRFSMDKFVREPNEVVKIFDEHDFCITAGLFETVSPTFVVAYPLNS